MSEAPEPRERSETREPPQPELDRIAIVMMSAIGDAVHVLPVINALKRHVPGGRITWILEPRPASLVRGHPALDELIEFSARGGLRCWLELRKALSGRVFDVVLDLQVAIKAGLVTSLINAPVKLGFDRARAGDLNWLFTSEKIAPHANQHVQDQYFEFLHHLRVPHDPVEWNLGPWPHERDREGGGGGHASWFPRRRTPSRPSRCVPASPREIGRRNAGPC